MMEDGMGGRGPWTGCNRLLVLFCGDFCQFVQRTFAFDVYADAIFENLVLL